jgi:hypothetical protein
LGSVPANETVKNKKRLLVEKRLSKQKVTTWPQSEIFWFDESLRLGVCTDV